MSKFKIGEKVRYVPKHGAIEKGIVKGFPPKSVDSAFVVYNCGGDWENYQDYTGANTNFRDLVKGW